MFCVCAINDFMKDVCDKSSFVLKFDFNRHIILSMSVCSETDRGRWAEKQREREREREAERERVSE